MENDKEFAIRKEYINNKAKYEVFTKTLENLINDILKAKRVRIHSVTSRVKSLNSLIDKINKPDAEYNRLDDVKDISGIRIITYFSDDVDHIADIIKKEFDIDLKSSVDKRTILDPDRFGYLSLHYSVKLPKSRLALTEFNPFKGLSSEIQIRSILQHTWAEIEHDLGYKSNQAVPKDIRRRFSRLAGLLELADEEFVLIRNKLKEYENKLPEEVKNSPATVLIDKASLVAYVRISDQIQKLDKIFMSPSLFNAKKIELDSGWLANLIDRLQCVGLKTIGDINNALNVNKKTIVGFAKIWLHRPKPTRRGYQRAPRTSIYAGICMFYLFYVLLAQKKSAKEIQNSLVKCDFCSAHEAKNLAKTIMTRYKAATKNR